MTESNASSGLHFKSVCYTGLAPGPRVIILGAVHGNETCGTKAIHRVMDEIYRRRLRIVSGSVTFVPIANPLAYARGERAGERNLNRNLFPTEQPADFEDHVANWLCPLLAQHEVLLDLHSTRARNEPFALLGPDNNSDALEPFTHAEQERALAKRLGVRRFVDGWLSTYARGVERRARAEGGVALNSNARYGVGTTEYMRSAGGYAITLECGQHDDPASAEVAYRAIHNTLSYLGLATSPPPDPVAEFEWLRMYEVIDRAHPDDSFSRVWSSFDRLAKGDLIATRHDGSAVVAESEGRILFPDAKAEPGNEWFYLAKSASDQ